VTVVGDADLFPDAVLESLRKSGCLVKQLSNSLENRMDSNNGEELGDYPTEQNHAYAAV
jgi:hypothetical protein